jgi:hypothetical protein
MRLSQRRFLGPEASIARYAVIGDADRKLWANMALSAMLCNVYDDQGGSSTTLSTSA